MLETILILGFVAFLTVLTTAGWVLFLYFWLGGLPRGTRSFAAALLGSATFMVPILVLGGGGGVGSDEIVVSLIAVAVLAGLVGLPTAIIANRKLERIGTDPAAAFE